MQAKTGVNLTGGEAPSMKMMWALANDPELRQAAENLMLSLKAAGEFLSSVRVFIGFSN